MERDRTPLLYLFGDRRVRRNVWALLKVVIVLGEGIDLFSETLPRSLNGKTLGESNIGAQTGLNVIAVRQNGEVVTSPPASTLLRAGDELLLFGGAHQRRHFVKLFGAGA